jgi:hypothetical protein
MKRIDFDVFLPNFVQHREHSQATPCPTLPGLSLSSILCTLSCSKDQLLQYTCSTRHDSVIETQQSPMILGNNTG